MKSSKVFEEIRLTVVGDWIPPQLVGALALQRAEVPEVPVRLTEAQLVGEEPNLVLSTSNRIPPGQSKEAIWFDTLGVALAKRSHLLAYPEVPCSEISPQQVIHAMPGLLDVAVRSVMGAKEESDVDSFFGGGTTGFLENDVAGLDDFELVCFLVVRPRC